MRLTLFQAKAGPELHVGIRKPVDDEVRPFEPADSKKRSCQIALGSAPSQTLGIRSVAAMGLMI